MAGTKASGRPGGNPDLKKYSYATERDEPCSAAITFRFAPSDLQRLKAIPNFRELVREKVREIINEHEV